MNKRMKKKHELENRLRIAEGAIDFLIDQNNQLWDLVERNALATNSEITAIKLDATKLAECINQLKSVNNSMRVDLNQAILDFIKPKKKSFFNRK